MVDAKPGTCSCCRKKGIYQGLMFKPSLPPLSKQEDHQTTAQLRLDREAAVPPDPSVCGVPTVDCDPELRAYAK